jgi:hypothetical protein
MAFNEILVGRFNRYVQKLLVIKNTALRNLNPDLQVNLPLLSGVEERYLQGWNRFAQEFVIVAPGVGNSAGCRIRNPAANGVIVVIEYFTIDGPAAGDYRIQVGATTVDLATSAASQGRLDPRGNPASSAVVSITSAASTTATLGNAATFRESVSVAFGLVQFPATVNQELTVLPGDAFQIQNQTANQAFTASAIWRERILESSELT